LPEPLRYDDFKGEWGTFLASVYGVFERDFKHYTPRYEGRPVTHDSRIEDGKEAAFWHIISRNDPRTGNRELNIRRCERITWVRPLIEHPVDQAVSTWRSERKKPNKKSQTRVYRWLEDHDYIVVMAERPRQMVLVTAFCTDIRSEREKLRAERDKYLAQIQKPPFRAT
jgi:hypothetical protein